MIKKKINKILSFTGFELKSKHMFLVNNEFMKKFLYLHRYYEIIKNIQGDIVECGVGYGKSFLILSFLAFQEAGDRKIWGFDSFEGFPEPSLEDKSFRNPQKGEWGGYAPNDIEIVLKKAGIHKDFIKNNIILTKGFFKDSLELYSGKPIALLHIDAGLYQSYQEVLKKLFPIVAKGGVVLFDEYNNPKWPGATSAVNEYFADIDYKIKKDEKNGKYFVLKKF